MSHTANLAVPTFANPATPTFVDRRQVVTPGRPAGNERRQFANTHDLLSPAAAELAKAIDQYKAQHRRRFINFEEMLFIFQSLGYEKTSN